MYLLYTYTQAGSSPCSLFDNFNKYITMEKYLVTIEFRYNDDPNYGDNLSQYVNKVITLGTFDTRDEANLIGNKALEIFEDKFKLNSYYNKKERFSNHGGCFGYPNDLITELAYLQTPFSFFAKITKLKYDDVEQTIVNAIEACKRYEEYKNSNQ